jgi:hypothetical protein
MKWQKKLYNEEFHNLYSLPEVTVVLKLGWMRWAGHVVGRKYKKRKKIEN